MRSSTWQQQRPCNWNLLRILSHPLIFHGLSMFLNVFHGDFPLRKLRKLRSRVVVEAFYGGCVIAALEHLHERKIIYRDLKPEILGSKGPSNHQTL